MDCNRSVVPVSGVAAVGASIVEQRADPVRRPPCTGISAGAGRRQRQRPVGPLPCPYRLGRTVTVDCSVEPWNPSAVRGRRSELNRRIACSDRGSVMTTALSARCPTPVAPLPPWASGRTLTLSVPKTLPFSMPIDTPGSGSEILGCEHPPALPFSASGHLWSTVLQRPHQ